jgi:hypothetical protein
MKVVVCTVPYMPPYAVQAAVYPVDGNKAIEYNKPVRSPVNAVLAKTMKKGEELRVIYIMAIGKNSFCEDNKKIFIEELESINTEIGAVLSYDTVEIASVPSKQMYNKLISDLADKIPENAELYTDITYGYKTEILSLFCALRFVEEFRGAVVQYFIYGHRDKDKEDRKKADYQLFDVTSLYYLFQLIGSIGAADAEKASKILKDFFAI